MPLPGSGPLRVSCINAELSRTATTANSYFAGSSTPLPFSLFGLGNQYGILNQSAPHSLSEWYGYSSIILNGLVLHLNAAVISSYPQSGTVWTDLSGNSNTGTLINGPTFSSANGGNIVLDGTNDYIEVANAASLNSSTCTIDIWFRYTTANNYYAMLIGKHDPAGSYNGWNMYIFNNVLYAQVKRQPPSSPTDTNFTGFSISTTPWYNAVLSITSGGTGTFYVNGSAVNSQSVFAYNVSSQPLRIARSVDSFWSNFGGNIACLKLYNRALSASEVLQNYNALKSRFGL